MDQQLTEEVKKLNSKIDEIKNSGKLMIYSANPFKFAVFNFIAGIFNTLGSLFGYLVIFGIAAYFLSQINLGNVVTGWLEKTMGQVDWNKVVNIAPGVPGGLKPTE